ncbi:MAG: hypothetical protein ACFB9M_12850 [Myxococcota bacterium]
MMAVSNETRAQQVPEDEDVILLQEEEEPRAPPTDGRGPVQPSAPADEVEPPPTPTSSSGAQADFRVRHGWFARADIGGFFSLGGFDVDPVTGAISDNTVGNVQPLVGITVGRDVWHSLRNNLAVGARFTGIFSASSVRLPESLQTPEAAGDAATVPGDVEAFQFGAAVDYTYFFGPRFGLLVHGDVGVSLNAPNPDVPATDGGVPIVGEAPSGDGVPGERVIGAQFSGGLGVEYYTRLEGFAVGAVASFHGITNNDAFIPGIGFYIPLKYNF